LLLFLFQIWTLLRDPHFWALVSKFKVGDGNCLTFIGTHRFFQVYFVFENHFYFCFFTFRGQRFLPKHFQDVAASYAYFVRVWRRPFLSGMRVQVHEVATKNLEAWRVLSFAREDGRVVFFTLYLFHKTNAFQRHSLLLNQAD